MKKSDLKDGMIIELSNVIFGILINGFIRHRMGAICLKEFNEDMTYNLYKSKNVDIIAIYSPIDIDNDGTNIEDIMRGNSLRKRWERPREIDWSKVPFGTKVQASDHSVLKECRRNSLVSYEKRLKKPFLIFNEELNEVFSYKYCRIHPSVKIQEGWYKE